MNETNDSISKKACSPKFKEWANYRWISADILPKEEIESAREDLDERTFRQEFEGSFVNDEGEGEDQLCDFAEVSLDPDSDKDVNNKVDMLNRFNKLTNLDIVTHYKNKGYYLMKSDFLGAFAYYVVYQSPYDAPDITEALKAFDKYMSRFINDKMSNLFSYDLLVEIINEKTLESIPAIEKLNHAEIEGVIASSSLYHDTKPEYDYIDLGALARNIVFMILRNAITEG